MPLGGIFRSHWRGGRSSLIRGRVELVWEADEQLVALQVLHTGNCDCQEQWRNHNRKEIHGLSFHSDRRGFNFAPPAIDLAVELDACAIAERLPMHQAPAV